MKMVLWKSVTEMKSLYINRNLEDCAINIVKNVKHSFLMSPVLSCYNAAFTTPQKDL